MTEIGIARNKAIQRVREFFAARPYLKLPAFARRAVLHRNTLYGFHSAGWNPTHETLEKCLAAIDAMEAEEAAQSKKRPRGGRVTASLCPA